MANTITMRILRLVCTVIAATAALLLPLSAFAQGSLTPPGPPSPTMKKLDEVEPRTNLQATPAPAGVDTSDADYHFIINQPGSYYLSANLVVTKTNGIKINAEGVTLDLNGFQISRTTPAGYGIQISDAGPRATIRNGSIKGFVDGIIGSAAGGAFRDLAVTGCTNFGILTAFGAVVDSCRAHDNSGVAGIYAGGGSTVSNCTASNNSASSGIATSSGCALINCAAFLNSGIYGINAGTGSSLTNCSASLNTSTLSTSGGINAGSGSTLAHCSSYNNGSTSPTPSATTGIGFNLGTGCRIQSCTAELNRGDGIRVTSECVVLDNHCGYNGNGGGVHLTASNNRIEGNNVISNFRGILADGAGNLIIKNSASDNTIDYSFVANNRYGAVVDISATGTNAVNGKSAVDTTATSSPLANFSY